MSIRTWTVAGLAMGAVAGVILVSAAVALAPAPRSSGGAVPTASPAMPPGAPASASPSGPSGATPGAAGTTPAIVGSRGSQTVMHVGEAAPVLALPQVGGGLVDLAALRGRPVWVLFVASTCAECTSDLRLMADYVARYGRDGLVGIVVDVGESESVAAAFARRSGITLPIGLDLDSHARDAWEVVGLPAHVWIDRLQVVRDAAPASIPTESMAESLALILPGVTVTP